MKNQKVLENIHQLQYPERGQNYVFNGYMKYLIECLGEKEEYDYYFFSFISGDCVAQVFGQNKDRWHPSLSQSRFDYDLIKRVFDSIGYSFAFVSPDELKAEPEKYKQMIMAYIDKGLPVIGKGFNNCWDNKAQMTDEVSCIVGYTDNGRTFFRLPEEATNLMPINLEDEYSYKLVFVGDKTAAPSLADVYKNTFFNIPNLLTLPPLNGVSFGIQAFIDWANAVVSDFYDIAESEFDCWRVYTIYVCNLATNLFSKQFIDRTFDLNPELAYIKPDFDEIYADMEKTYVKLKEQGGEFNITYETLQNKDKRKAIAETIAMFGHHFDNLYKLVLQEKNYG
jgi:hypothetical protein